MRRPGLLSAARDTVLSVVAGAAVALVLFGLSFAILVAIVVQIGTRHGL